MAPGAMRWVLRAAAASLARAAGVGAAVVGAGVGAGVVGAGVVGADGGADVVGTGVGAMHEQKMYRSSDVSTPNVATAVL